MIPQVQLSHVAEALLGPYLMESLHSVLLSVM